RARQDIGVRQIQDDESSGLVRLEHGVGPGDGAAPIVADDDRLVFLEMLAHRIDVAYEFVHGVAGDAGGVIALVVAAQVDGGDLKVFGEGGDLVTPGIPEIGEAVEEDDERAGAGGDHVNLDAGGIGERFVV